MSDVVNAELLRENIAHALSGLDADTWAYALGEYRRMLGEPFPRPQVADRSSVADAFRQADKVVAILPGLQAEAPEDAEVLREVMLALEDLSFECFSPIAPCNPPSVATYSRTFDVLDRHRKARGWATVPKTAISKPRTSQAEAQAPAVTQKREREGHKYADHDGTSDCAHGCGAWMGPFRSGAPNGINPFGECPKAPLLQTPAQAEAQAPTTAVDRSAALENTDDAPPAIVLAAVRACAASWVPEARILGNVRAGDIVRALTTTAALTKIAVHREVVAAIQSFTAGVNMFEAANEAASCIIALQTTTAASVLTEDDRRIYNQSMTRYWEKASDELMAARLRAIIDRLTSTVGAPAPAHTKFVAVNSAQDIDDVIADIMKPAKGDTP